MNKLIVKYAIALGDSWFTGFSYKNSQPLVGEEKGRAMLLDEEEVKMALDDLAKCGKTGIVYEVHLRAIGNARFG